MPYTPKRLCPKCKGIFRAARCPTCARARDQERGNRHERGYGARHEVWREQVLAQSATCQACGAEGQPYDHADHIDPQGSRDDPANGQRLCHSCHSRKTLQEQRSRGEVP